MPREVTPLQRELKAEAKKRKRLKPISDKRQAELALRRLVWEKVLERDGGCRFPHDQVPDLPCMGGMSPHHLLKSSQGGQYTMDNLITLCVASNGWIEDHPRRATELGLVHYR